MKIARVSCHRVCKHARCRGSRAYQLDQSPRIVLQSDSLGSLRQLQWKSVRGGHLNYKMTKSRNLTGGISSIVDRSTRRAIDLSTRIWGFSGHASELLHRINVVASIVDIQWVKTFREFCQLHFIANFQSIGRAPGRQERGGGSGTRTSWVIREQSTSARDSNSFKTSAFSFVL